MIKRVLLILGLVGVFAGSASAQTALTKTTLTNAITAATTDTIVVGSATDVIVDSRLFLDRELMRVLAVNGTTVRVQRAAGNTQGTNHLANAQIWVIRPEQVPMALRTYSKTGSCTAANEAFLPQINTTDGTVQTCATVSRTAGVIATAVWSGFTVAAPNQPGFGVTLVSDANYISNEADTVIVYNTLTANRVVILPSVSVPGKTLIIANNSQTNFQVTTAGLIAGSTTYSVAVNAPLRLVWSGSNWFVW